MNKYGKITATSTSAEQLPNSKLSLTDIQQQAIDRIASLDQAIIIAPTGAGKTTTLLHVMRNKQQRFIVACPPKVMDVWDKEVIKWGIPVSVGILHGDQEMRLSTLAKQPDIVVVSLNNLEWLLAQNHGCTAILIDELSKATGKQTKELRYKRSDYITTRYGMTATPVSENYQKLFDMCRIIDKGVALGTRKEAYLNKYFIATDYKGYKLELKENAHKEIMDKVKPLLVDLAYNKQQLLPPKTEKIITFSISPEARTAYDTMRKDMIIEDYQAIAPNAAVMTSKLRQIASGFIIDEVGEVKEIDDSRVVTLANFLPEGKAIIIYEYTHQRIQLERLLTQFGRYYVSLYGGSDRNVIDTFINTNVQYLIAQHATLSHGVDGLQHVCNTLVFLQPLWSADSTEQAIGRVWRQGQKNPVTIYHFVAENTIDNLVLSRLDSKAEYMKLFMEHLRGE